MSNPVAKVNSKLTWPSVLAIIIITLIAGLLYGLGAAKELISPFDAYTTSRVCDFVDYSGSVIVACEDGTMWDASFLAVPE